MHLKKKELYFAKKLLDRSLHKLNGSINWSCISFHSYFGNGWCPL